MFLIINFGIMPFIITKIINKLVIDDKICGLKILLRIYFLSAIIMGLVTYYFNINSSFSELILIVILIGILLLSYLFIRLYKRKHATTSKQCRICDETFIYKFRMENKEICDSCYKKM